MDILFLVLAIASQASISIFSSFFVSKNVINKNGSIIFNLFGCFAPLLCWGIYYVIEGGFNPTVLLYSLGYGLCFIGSFIFLQLGIKYGPLSFTSLFVQFSLVFTSIWGIFFWNTKTTYLTIPGFILVGASICFCILKKEGKKFSFKWLIFALLSCLSNGVAAIIVKTEQVNFNNQYGSQMMFFGFIIATFLSTLLFILMKKKIELPNIKRTSIWAMLAGLGIFFVNFFVILLANTDMSTSIIYPCIGVGGLLITTLYSVIFKKERLTILQIIGFALGVLGIIFLSIEF